MTREEAEKSWEKIPETWSKIKGYVSEYPNENFMRETSSSQEMNSFLGGECKTCKSVLTTYSKTKTIYPEIKRRLMITSPNFDITFTYTVCTSCKVVRFAKIIAYNSSDSTSFEKVFETVLVNNKHHVDNTHQ